MNILIVKLSAIGDVIHTLPALNAVRRHFPEARITWLVEAAASDLVIGHRAVDRVLVSARKKWLRDFRGPRFAEAFRETRNFIKALRDTRYDMILDFQALLKSSLLIALAKGRRKIGFGPGLEHMEHSYLLLNERIPAVDMEHHALTRGLMLLNAVGIPTPLIEYRLPIDRVERRKAEEILGRCGLRTGRPLVAVNPVAKWETKLWPNRNFARLADRLVERFGAAVFFTGGREDRRTVEEIVGVMKTPAVNLAGQTTLKMLAALYACADTVISTDTGPMHLAAAAGTPVVALFGPTEPRRTGPFGPGHQVVRAGLDCAPCFKRQCQSTDCMARITVEQVVDAAFRIIGG